jgi:hypothetical protein
LLKLPSFFKHIRGSQLDADDHRSQAGDLFGVHQAGDLQDTLIDHLFNTRSNRVLGKREVFRDFLKRFSAIAQVPDDGDGVFIDFHGTLNPLSERLGEGERLGPGRCGAAQKVQGFKLIKKIRSIPKYCQVE